MKRDQGLSQMDIKGSDAINTHNPVKVLKDEFIPTTTTETSTKIKKTIITSALPYVNNSPHLGNLIGSLLSADVYTRYRHKICKNDEKIIFVAGVDEYGTATEIKAKELGVSCKELCDNNSNLHKDVYDWFLIKPDCYGRTSQPNGDPADIQLDWPQTKITHDIFKNLCNNGYVIEQKEQVMYCPSLNTFVADRFVIGTCSNCKYVKANGDQCDMCGKLLSACDIIDPRYKPNTSLSLEIREIYNLYIDTEKIWNDNDMNTWFESSNIRWTKSAKNITRDWLNMGLKPRSITRDLLWGTSVPDTFEFGNKYASKVFYVWFDAPIGYISITEESLGEKTSESFWRDPETNLIQFMAKDNVPFHSVIFPVSLRGSGYSSLSNVDIVSIEYLMYEGGKFSKTNNTGLFCDDVMNISTKLGIPPDYWRAYLVMIRPESADSNFVLNDGGFVDFVNNILLKNFGNMIHRVLSMTYQIHLKHKVDQIKIDNVTFSTEDRKLSNSSDNISSNNVSSNNISFELNILYNEYCVYMDEYSLSLALRKVLDYSKALNQSLNEFTPWIMIKHDDKILELYQFMRLIYEHVEILLDMFEPFMPSICDKIRQNLIYEIKDDSMIITLLKSKPNIVIKQLEYIKL